MVTTNDFVDDSVETDVDETVVAGGSKDKGVNIFNQLALMMVMMSGMKTEIKSEINVVNMSLNEMIKSENNNLKAEIKSEVDTINVKLTDLNNEAVVLTEN